jgi:hypothetical protein
MKIVIKNAFYTTLGLVIIGAGIYSTFILLSLGWSAFSHLSEGGQVAIALGILSLISTLGSIIYTKVKEKKLQIAASNTAKKQKLYAKFTDGIIELLAKPELGEDDDHTHKVRVEFMKNAILWSDPKVLRAYHNFRMNHQAYGNDAQDMWDIATLFLEFRNDLGLSNKSLDQHDIMDIFYDQEYLAEFKERFSKK